AKARAERDRKKQEDRINAARPPAVKSPPSPPPPVARAKVPAPPPPPVRRSAQAFPPPPSGQALLRQGSPPPGPPGKKGASPMLPFTPLVGPEDVSRITVAAAKDGLVLTLRNGESLEYSLVRIRALSESHAEEHKTP